MTQYAGTYVAVVHETLVAVGNAGKEVEDKARAIAPDTMPSVLRVPRAEDMACLLSLLPLSGTEGNPEGLGEVPQRRTLLRLWRCSRHDEGVGT